MSVNVEIPTYDAEISEYVEKLYKKKITSYFTKAGIQKNSWACGIYSLNFVFNMARMHNLYDLLARNAEIDKKYSFFYTVKAKLLPPQLIKNAEATKFIRLYKNSLIFQKYWKNKCINKKGETLAQYRKRTKSNIKGHGDNAIIRKANKYYKRKFVDETSPLILWDC